MCHLFQIELFIIFLNNLFLNINIAYILLTINFAVIDTTQKNVTGLPLSLTDILAKDKETKKNRESNKKNKKK